MQAFITAETDKKSQSGIQRIGTYTLCLKSRMMSQQIIAHKQVWLVPHYSKTRSIVTTIPLYQVFGLCTCSPYGLSLEWGTRELKPNHLFIKQ